MKTNRLFLLLILIVLLALSACEGGAGQQPTDLPPEEPAIGLPNPASVYCEEHDGKLEIRTVTDGGQYGVCMFEDDSECEEWAYFRGECQPGDFEEVELPPKDE